MIEPKAGVSMVADEQARKAARDVLIGQAIKGRNRVVRDDAKTCLTLMIAAGTL